MDDKHAYVSDGSQNDHFGWHSFDQLSDHLPSEVAAGKDLAVTDIDGKRIVVGLQGTKQAISPFIKCGGVIADCGN